MASEYAASAIVCGRQPQALDRLASLHRRAPSLDLLAAMALLDTDPQRQRERAAAFLVDQPTLSAAQRLLQLATAHGPPLADDETRAVTDAVGRAALPLQRFRCAACGFEARHYFWQCPGCMAWDSYPPERLDAV